MFNDNMMLDEFGNLLTPEEMLKRRPAGVQINPMEPAMAQPVSGSIPAGRPSGQLADTSMPPIQMAQAPQGLLDRLRSGMDERGISSSDALMAIGSGMLGLSNDQGLQQLGLSGFGQIAKGRETREAKAKADAITNRTVEELRKRKRDDLADAVESGLMPATEAAKMLYGQGDMKVVGKSAIRFNPTTGKVDVLYTDNSGGSDEATAAFRTLKARAEEAGLKAGTPEYQQFMVDGGTKSGFAMRIGEDGSIEMVQGGASLPKLTEGQAKATGFLGRMQYLSPIINKYEQQGTQLFDNIVKGIPIAGNFLASPEYRQYDFAKQNWIAAQLRDESGAAIGTDEYINADKQYFPQVGDDPATIAAKKKLREKAQESMQTKSGAAPQPPVNKPAQSGTVKIGDIVNGHRFKGGNPSDKNSWEKI